MLDRFLTAVVDAVVQTISYAGYVGIAVLMAVESACVPLPSEIIMPFAGYLVSIGRFQLVWVATAGALGCNLGSTAAYFVGAYGGRRLVQRWGSLLFVRQEELVRVEAFFKRYGPITIFVGRLLPVVRTFISLPAGIARMGQLRFQLYTFIGSWLWCYALAFVGMKLGERWNSDPALRAVFRQLDFAIIAGILLMLFWFAWRRWRQR
jgi:membrane protein DedA with SNARE-associated domain